MKIFYIEDNRMNFRLVQKMLKRDHDVQGAVTGQGGLDKIALDPPELILLDIVSSCNEIHCHWFSFWRIFFWILGQFIWSIWKHD